MGLHKGVTNNPHGRRKGSENKGRAELRELVTAFLDNNFQRIEKLIKELEPREQVRVYIDLLQFGLPKLQAVNVDATFERLDDYQLDELLNRLRDGSTKHTERKNNI